jgi:hypothetical protein
MPKVPVGPQHAGFIPRTAGDTGDNDLDQVDQDFAAQLAEIQGYFQKNKDEYENKRGALGLEPKDLRVISNVGLDEIFNNTFDIKTTSKPTFRYVAPRPTPEIYPFREGISFVVMHSFGRGQVQVHAQNKTDKYVKGYDAQTGFSPLVFRNGIKELTNPDPKLTKAIHHLVSRRGDLVNSVSWDTQCTHGGGGTGAIPIQGVNASSIGIEHEESWQANPENPTLKPRSVIDHVPYTEEQFLVDAFILKKLETYTQNTFSRYLGFGDELRNNFQNKVTGCFNHSCIRNSDGSTHHDDPSGQYNLPPGYLLRTTALSTIPVVQQQTGRWQKWLDLWFANTPNGTKIGAYDRIFEKMARIRTDKGYNLQTEVFDDSLRNLTIPITVPDVRGSRGVALAQSAAVRKLRALERAQQMQAVPRADHYGKAGQTTDTAATVWATQGATLAQLTKAAASAPAVENALRLDSNTGKWTRGG